MLLFLEFEDLELEEAGNSLKILLKTQYVVEYVLESLKPNMNQKTNV